MYCLRYYSQVISLYKKFNHIKQKVMKKLILMLIGVTVITSLKAQSGNSEPTGTSKSVYVEVLGSGIGFSANFDSRFMGSKGFGFRVGVGYVPLTGASTLTIPFGLNYITGAKSSHFEAEATATVLTASGGKLNGKTVSALFIYPHIGYRYTKPSKSFLGRIYAGPILFNGHALPFAGISLGYTL
jgi:hypothetical protein